MVRLTVCADVVAAVVVVVVDCLSRLNACGTSVGCSTVMMHRDVGETIA